MTTIRINGYSVAKIQAIKLLRSWYPELGLKYAKSLIDEVDQNGSTTFQTTLMPGAKLALLCKDGVDVELVDSLQITLTFREQELVLKALEAYAAVVGLINSPEAPRARLLAHKVRS